MNIRIVGGGVGRTGTVTLKTALERLTGGASLHMTGAIRRVRAVPPHPTDFRAFNGLS